MPAVCVYGLTPRKGVYPIGETGTKGEPLLITREQDVFDILGIPYRAPAERNVVPK